MHARPTTQHACACSQLVTGNLQRFQLNTPNTSTQRRSCAMTTLQTRVRPETPARGELWNDNTPLIYSSSPFNASSHHSMCGLCDNRQQLQAGHVAQACHKHNMGLRPPTVGQTTQPCPATPHAGTFTLLHAMLTVNQMAMLSLTQQARSAVVLLVLVRAHACRR